MKEFALVGTPRSEYGKKAAKALRAEELIPCNIYGCGLNATFTVAAADVRKLIYSPDTQIVDLTIGETKTKAVVKETQFHPIDGKTLHIDFLAVDEKKPVVVEIPIQLNGLAGAGSGSGDGLGDEEIDTSAGFGMPKLTGDGEPEPDMSVSDMLDNVDSDSFDFDQFDETTTTGDEEPEFDVNKMPDPFPAQAPEPAPAQAPAQMPARPAGTPPSYATAMMDTASMAMDTVQRANELAQHNAHAQDQIIQKQDEQIQQMEQQYAEEMQQLFILLSDNLILCLGVKLIPQLVELTTVGLQG